MISSTLPADLKNHLSTEIEDTIHELLLNSYESWKSKGCPAYSPSENDITLMIIEEMKSILASEGRSPRLLPIIEHSEPDDEIRKGKKSANRSKRVDVAVYWDLNEESRYRIECKRIGTTGLSREYVNNGIGRFVRNEYAQKQNKSTMLGYVQNGKSLSQSRDSINREIASGGNQHLNLLSEPSVDTIIYHSSHPRGGNNSPIRLTHIFLRFRITPTSAAS